MELTEMCNIGAGLRKKLNAIGIKTGEELLAIGSKEAFFKMKTAFPEVCLVHLYALYGAIENIEYNKLPMEIKKELKAFSDNIK